MLLKALQLVATSSTPFQLELDILGIGELAEDCASAAAEFTGSTRVQVLGAVPYGQPFFQLLRGYHAIVLPSISDEQPRIVYDAYSQGVPALATKTAGLRDCVLDGRTGWLVEPNDALALSELLRYAAHQIFELQRMGMEALKVARTMTHQRMHRERQRLLLELPSVSGA